MTKPWQTRYGGAYEAPEVPTAQTDEVSRAVGNRDRHVADNTTGKHPKGAPQVGSKSTGSTAATVASSVSKPVAPLASPHAGPSPLAGDAAPGAAGEFPSPMPSTGLQPPPPPHPRCVSYLKAILFPVFGDECVMVATDALPVFSRHVSEGLIQWHEDLALRCAQCAERYCAKVKEHVDATTSENIRRHYPRAPALQATVYEVRVREIEDGMQARIKYFQWLHQRVGTAQTSAETALTTSHNPVEAAVTQMSASCAALPSITVLNSLDAHQRSFNERKHHVLEEIACCIHAIPQQFRKGDGQRSLRLA